MNTNWIDDVLLLNTRITAAEARLNTQVAKVLAMVMQGQDTSDAEGLITSYGQRLIRLQADLLQEPSNDTGTRS